MASGTPTIQDVARRAGVSTATVSRTLSAPDRVAAKTRAAVMEAVRTTGYSVNRAARTLRTNQTGSVIVLVPNLGNPFFSEILAGIETVFAEEAMSVMVLDTSGLPVKDDILLRVMAEGQGDGIISLDGGLSLRALAAFEGSAFGGRLVFACEWVAGSDLPSVRSDNAAGARCAVEHLAALGHRHIGHVKGPPGNILSAERESAYRAAMAAAGLPVQEGWILPGDFGLASGRAAAAVFAEMPQRPSAVFCASDQMAIGMIGEFQRRGMQVPAEISVTGFDDISIAGFVWPGLTTVRQDRARLGREAASLLLGRLRGEIGPGAAPVVVPVALVPRGTSAAPV